LGEKVEHHSNKLRAIDTRDKRKKSRKIYETEIEKLK